MKENKNTRPSAATLERAGLEKAVGKASISKSYNNRYFLSSQELFERLPTGEENAVTGPELAKRLGLKDTRHLRQVVEKARGDGFLVLSSFEHSGGYFAPSGGEKGKLEIKRYYQSQRSHAMSMLYRLAPARRALGIPDGQLDFGEVE